MRRMNISQTWRINRSQTEAKHQYIGNCLSLQIHEAKNPEPLRPLLTLFYPRIYFHTGPAHYQCPISHLNFTCSQPFPYTPHSQSQFQVPHFLRTFPEPLRFVTGCFNHYSYPLPITTALWETTSPPTIHSHIVLLSSFFIWNPPASNLLTLPSGLQEFPVPTQER